MSKSTKRKLDKIATKKDKGSQNSQSLPNSPKSPKRTSKSGEELRNYSPYHSFTLPSAVKAQKRPPRYFINNQIKSSISPSPSKTKSTKYDDNRARIHDRNAKVMISDDLYKVTFKSRILGLELIPYDHFGNSGALVIRCLTDIASKCVTLYSFIVCINETIVSDWRHNDILKKISKTHKRPITLTFHLPVDADSFHLSIRDAKLGDSVSDEHMNDYGVQFMKNLSPETVFNSKEDEEDKQESLVESYEKQLKRIKTSYRQLYHFNLEMQQFQNVTKDSIRGKVEELSIIRRENLSLIGRLHLSEHELEQLHSLAHRTKENLNENQTQYMIENEKLLKKHKRVQKENDMLKEEIRKLKVQLDKKSIQYTFTHQQLKQVTDVQHISHDIAPKKPKHKSKQMTTRAYRPPPSRPPPPPLVETNLSYKNAHKRGRSVNIYIPPADRVKPQSTKARRKSKSSQPPRHNSVTNVKPFALREVFSAEFDQSTRVQAPSPKKKKKRSKHKHDNGQRYENG